MNGLKWPVFCAPLNYHLLLAMLVAICWASFSDTLWHFSCSDALIIFRGGGNLQNYFVSFPEDALLNGLLFILFEDIILSLH